MCANFKSERRGTENISQCSQSEHLCTENLFREHFAGVVYREHMNGPYVWTFWLHRKRVASWSLKLQLQAVENALSNMQFRIVSRDKSCWWKRNQIPGPERGRTFLSDVVMQSAFHSLVSCWEQMLKRCQRVICITTTNTLYNTCYCCKLNLFDKHTNVHLIWTVNISRPSVVTWPTSRPILGPFTLAKTKIQKTQVFWILFFANVNGPYI